MGSRQERMEPEEEVAEAVQTVYSSLVMGYVEEERACGVDLLSHRKGDIETITGNALESKCREACARAIVYLWLGHRSSFSQLYLVQAVDDNRAQGVLYGIEVQEYLKSGFRLRKRYPDFVRDSKWAHHCYFVVHDKFGGWWYGSPANGSYTEYGYGGDLRRVLDSIRQEGGLWPMAGYIKSLERQGWLGIPSWMAIREGHLHYDTWRMDGEEREELVRRGVTGVRVPVVVREAAGNREKQYATYYPVYFE